jgi:hypothetical protein
MTLSRGDAEDLEGIDRAVRAAVTALGHPD